MHDVAAAAGVSLKTVSRVMNDERGVDPQTRAKVRGSVAELGYQRNEVARNLRPGQRSYTIGLVIEDIGNPFYSAMTRGAEEVSRANGFMVLSASSDESPERERELLCRMLRRQVDGLLVVPAGADHEFLVPEMIRGTPVVFIDRPAGNVEADLVVLDNRGGVGRAVRHMLAQGHRRVAVVGDGEWVWTAAERLAGYRAALRTARMRFDPTLVRMGPHTAGEAQEAAAGLLAAPEQPDAILALNNRMTVGALRAVRAIGAAVEVVGFDDLELADLLAAPVTVVSHDAAELGRAAVRLLLRRLQGHAAGPETLVVPTDLVVRGG